MTEWLPLDQGRDEVCVASGFPVCPELMARPCPVGPAPSLGSEQLPPTDGLRFDLADGRRIIIRPSGTEPKLKCYLQVLGESHDHAKAGLEELTQAVKRLIN